jgi:hypothetical protein
MPDQTDTARPELLSPDELRNKQVDYLIALGVTDTTSAVRILEALTNYGFGPNDLPSSAHGSAIDLVLGELNPRERVQLGTIIALRGGAGEHDLWPDWLHTALERVEQQEQQENEVQSGLTALHDALTDTRAELARITHIVTRLDAVTGPDDDRAITDILRAQITAADLAVRTALALAPNPGKR